MLPPGKGLLKSSRDAAYCTPGVSSVLFRSHASFPWKGFSRPALPIVARGEPPTRLKLGFTCGGAAPTTDLLGVVELMLLCVAEELRGRALGKDGVELWRGDLFDMAGRGEASRGDSRRGLR